VPQDFEIRSQHFLKEMEQAIQAANREILSQRPPPITKENILPLAVSVTRPRSRYLGKAFRIAEADAGDAPGCGSVFTIAFPRQRTQTGY